VRFLRLPANMDLAIKRRNVHVVGELCHCLRIFGAKNAGDAGDADQLLRRGVSFLLREQLSDGSWPAADARDDTYSRYNAAMCATMGLYEPNFRGFGPSNSAALPILRKSARAPQQSEVVAAGGGLRQVASQWSATGLRMVRLKDMPGVARKYAIGASAPSGPAAEEPLDVEAQQAYEANLPAPVRAQRRLAGLLKWKRDLASKSLGDYEHSSAADPLGAAAPSPRGASGAKAKKVKRLDEAPPASAAAGPTFKQEKLDKAPVGRPPKRAASGGDESSDDGEWVG